MQRTFTPGTGRLATLAAISLAIIVLTAGGLAWGIARAQTPSPTIYACVGQTGAVRLVAEGEACKANETATNWSQQGPQGPEGPEGPKGDTGNVEVTVQLEEEGIGDPAAPVNMFLHIPDIAGESTDEEHAGEIEVLAWSWGMSRSGTTQVGGGAGAGKVNVQDISFTKLIDKASPRLQEAILRATHIPEAVLTVRRQAAEGEGDEYLVISLKNIMVTSLTTGGSNGDDRLTENVTLSFGKYELAYTEQNADGSAGDTHEVGWDIVENQR